MKILFYESIEVELEIFRKLQKVFNSSIFLIYYNLIRFLFVNLDASKR